jgi:putative RNA 2'-phosphotransferase
MGRQYVHLSADRETASSVGLRKGASPVILVVDAATAAAAGITFYEGNDLVWLADYVPARHIEDAE